MTTEEQLAIKLESIRDSIVGFKFATDALEIRANKMESDLAECRTRISDLSNTGIRVNEQLSVINKSMDTMSTDIRSVRNSVLSAIIGATIIWLIGTAASTFHLTNSIPSSLPSANRK
jgi:predicted  nucleic acid-binding Zn-ribbon protein